MKFNTKASVGRSGILPRHLDELKLILAESIDRIWIEQDVASFKETDLERQIIVEMLSWELSIKIRDILAKLLAWYASCNNIEVKSLE